MSARIPEGTPPREPTIAESVLAAVAYMRRRGALTEGTMLCHDATELESLAMFAIAAKNRAEVQP